MSSLPAGVKIGGFWWSIRSPNHELEDVGNFGRTISRREEIQVGTDISVQRQRECLLHEIIHALDCVTKLSKDTLKESEVKLLASGLFQVLSDNPDVARFICGLEGTNAADV